MKAIKDHFLVIVIFGFLLVQPLLSYIYNPDFFNKMPEVSWEGLQTGEYGVKLEKTLNDESFFAKVSNEKYRMMLYKFFYRLNENVIIGKKNFLFLPDQTNEIPEGEAKKDIPKILESIGAFKKHLDQAGIPLMLAVLPGRAKVFPDLAYKNGKFPPNREKYFNEVYQALDREGIAYYRLEDDLKKLRSEKNMSPFYRVDHHWTFEATELLAPKFVQTWQKLHGSLVPAPKPKRVYEYTWQEVVNEYNNIVHKLGFSRGTVPVKFKEVQKDPVFTPEKFNEEVNGRLMLIGSSYGGYGPVEFISNELGYRMPFIVVHGQSVKYMPSQMIHRNLSDPKKYGLPSGVVWVISEKDFRTVFTDNINYPPVLRASGEDLKFKFSKFLGGEVKDSHTLTQKEKTLKVGIKLKKKAKQIILEIRHDSGSDYSRSELKLPSGQHYYIVHDGERNRFVLESDKETDVFEFEIQSSRLKDKRDFWFGVSGV